MLFKITQLLPYLATLDELCASCYAGRRRPILAPNWKLGDTKCFIFFNFYSLIWFWELQIPFCEYLMPSPVRKADFNAFHVNLP